MYVARLLSLLIIFFRNAFAAAGVEEAEQQKHFYKYLFFSIFRDLFLKCFKVEFV